MRVPLLLLLVDGCVSTWVTMWRCSTLVVYGDSMAAGKSLEAGGADDGESGGRCHYAGIRRLAKG